MKPNLIELQVQLHQREAQSRSLNHEAPRKCPVCAATELVATLKQGIEIDRCPKCHGVWLDHGEVERLIELATSGLPAMRIPRVPLPGENGSDLKPVRDHAFTSQMGRKRSWLRDIFE